MSKSVTRQIINSINVNESSFDRIIPIDIFFIVRIRVDADINLRTSHVKYMMKNSPSCLAIYVYNNEMYLLFSSQEKIFNFPSSHHNICSFYTSLMSRYVDQNVHTSIFEAGDRIKIIAYFHVKIMENMNSEFCRLGDINMREIGSMTFQDIREKLQEKSIDMDSIKPRKLYGTFYKRYQDGNFSTLSEQIDTANISKYITYLFS